MPALLRLSKLPLLSAARHGLSPIWLALSTALSGALLSLPVTVAAQSAGAAAQQSFGTLELTVLDGEQSEPLANVQVLLSGRAAGTTDESGFVRLTRLPQTGLDVEVRLMGYQPVSLDVGVPQGETIFLTIPLEIDPVVLDGVRAEVEGSPYRSRQLAEFYQRVRTGVGEYITREDIERRPVRNLSDLMRTIPGIRLLATGAGEKPIMDVRGSFVGDIVNPDSQECAIQYFLDGTPIKPIHDGVIGAEVALQEIEGIEVYRRGSLVPAMYHRLHNNCGVILIWKKEKE